MRSIFYVLLSAKVALAAKVLAQKPQMGWNSWNSFKLNVSDELVRSTANALVDTGLAKLGYDHVLIDDGWQDSERDTDGKLAANHTRFPGGISATASYVHSKGLKVGIYSDAGIFTCGKYPGSYGYEEIDAQTFAGWGVDYLKYDNCGGFQSNTLSVQERFLKMSYALAASGRQIFYSLCEWGNQFPWLWADQIGESYRMSGDIYSSFAKDRASICKTAYCMNQGYAGVSVLTMIRKMREISPFSKPGSWADMDMLEIGTWTMTELEEQTHFSFWAALKSPLIIGADLKNISDTSLAIYKNKDIIALNQDDAGKPAVYLPKLSEEGSYQVWAGPLSSGKRRHVILVQNYGSGDVDVGISLKDIPGLSVEQQLKIRDVWAGKAIIASGGKVSLKGIKPTQTKVLVISK
ncbi:hypothetical protein NW756_010117 [Fusarium oxysporum]|nr:hypothetical protein NW763_003647 [Fusarium oxysporum]WKT47019.1 Glycoside hydrolase, family 27 [Fusarium oxysporum f. sp. vasinfectum]KAJ4067764.1 hypothetical protein NW753_002827 [Fusarium oxysporum]KAJ4082428.1 hypothetical protein NW756_010117 [Fusarium oxysporum]KAJ4108595.1 hypothetical protein NW769_008523 [Fusarium oxysporum]